MQMYDIQEFRLGYQVGAALVGGPAPLIATAILVKNNNSYIGIGIFIMAAACHIFDCDPIYSKYEKQRDGRLNHRAY